MKIPTKRLVQDFKVIRSNALLIPNKNHKNFTRSRETLQKDTIVKGFLIDIKGERRGKPFVYKLLRLLEPKYKRQYIFARAVQLNSPNISQPTAQPSRLPSSQPSNDPSVQPSSHPSSQPTVIPSSPPTRSP